MKEPYLACDRCGIVFAEKKKIGDWIHYADLQSGNVVTFFGPDGQKVCDQCMN